MRTRSSALKAAAQVGALIAVPALFGVSCSVREASFWDGGVGGGAAQACNIPPECSVGAECWIWSCNNHVCVQGAAQPDTTPCPNPAGGGPWLCDGQGQCAPLTGCGANGGTCGAGCPTRCEMGAPCQVADDCKSLVCDTNVHHCRPCNVENDCPDGATTCNTSINGGTCIMPCGSELQCTPSGLHCSRDNVCCDQACGELCKTCAKANTEGSTSDGTCAFVKAGMDPHNECTLPPNCKGDGTCGIL